MARLPDGDRPPADGALPAPALAGLGSRPFGLYIHVPYCAALCGYCDFNTYIAAPGDAGPRGHVDALLTELELARRVLGDDAPPATTVFVGGGTPTLLGAAELVRLLDGIRSVFGLADGAEVTTEANPESIDAAALAALRAGGYTRVSLGMQSAAAHVLAVLERRHTPGRAVAAAREARAAGFEHVSLDLIYGTAGESDADWERSLDAALEAGPDHVSAYALTVEPGTRLAAQIRRGTVAAPDDDVLAARYAAADRRLAGAGLDWYEISNWATGEPARCAHNIGYWSGGDWWGAGPGAHSQVGGLRWWNTLHPSAWADALTAGRSPAAGRELPDDRATRLERIMLGVRLAEGLPLGELTDAGRAGAARCAADGLLDSGRLGLGRAVLTLRGRLLADRVTLALDV